MTCVVDWTNVCLVCLQQSENRSVFQKEEDSDISIAEKIMQCSNVDVKKDINQPESICMKCLQDLDIAFKFHQNCKQSNSIIKAILSQDDRELEVSGLRIKIPPNLKVRKCVPELSGSTFDAGHVTENLVKNEYDECKNSDECENFDSADYLDNTEILEDDDDDKQKQVIQGECEEDEKLELISELEELKPISQNEGTETHVEQQKRGRGRPKKCNKNVETTCKPQEIGFRRAIYQTRKTPNEVKPQKICEICGNSYKYQHALNSHMRRHRNERPFNCEFCDKAFVSAVELRRHMRVHTGQKPYECQYCERRFSDYGSRIKHERTHTGERPYGCLTCGKHFAYAHVLTVHLRTHTGEKKYSCSVCGRGFTKKAYLDNHMTHHNTDAVTEDVYETCRATAAVAKHYDENVKIEGYVVLPTNGRLKLKEETCEDVITQEDFQMVAHV